MKNLQDVLVSFYGKKIGGAFFAEVTSPENMTKLIAAYKDEPSKLGDMVRRLLSNDAIIDKVGAETYMPCLPYKEAVDSFYNMVATKEE